MPYVPSPGVPLVADKSAIYATAPDHLIPLLRGKIESSERESFAAVALNRRHRVIDCEVLTIGCDGYCIVDPRQIYRWALTRVATPYALILSHNHPSGDPTPSPQDIEVTDRVVRAGRVLGITVLDHLIIGIGGTWESMAAAGHIPQHRGAGPLISY